jgi:hypothetical protein
MLPSGDLRAVPIRRAALHTTKLVSSACGPIGVFSSMSKNLPPRRRPREGRRACRPLHQAFPARAGPSALVPGDGGQACADAHSREFGRFWPILVRNRRANSGPYNKIPYATEQGIIFTEQGIYLIEQGICQSHQVKRRFLVHLRRSVGVAICSRLRFADEETKMANENGSRAEETKMANENGSRAYSRHSGERITKPGAAAT